MISKNKFRLWAKKDLDKYLLSGQDVEYINALLFSFLLL